MTRRGWVLFTSMGVIWGFPYLLIKVADGGVSVPVLVFARTGIGALVLLPLALRRRELGAMRQHWRWLAMFAAVEIILPWGLLSESERRLPSSLTGILIASVPIIVAVLARLTSDNDRLTVVRWTGLALGLSGVVLLAAPTARGGDAWAVAEVLLTALCYSIGPLIASRKLSEAPSLGVNAVCLSFAALVYAPFAALTWPPTVPQTNVIASIVALGVVCTGAAFMIFFALINEVGPARALVITYVNPAVAVALGVAILGEHLTPMIAVSFVLILAGSFFATRSGSAKARERRPDPSVDRPDPSVDRPDPSVDRPDPSVDRPDPSVDRSDPSVHRSDPSVDRPDPSVDRPGNRPALLAQEGVADSGGSAAVRETAADSAGSGPARETAADSAGSAAVSIPTRDPTP